jgi:hypothetical protein
MIRNQGDQCNPLAGCIMACSSCSSSSSSSSSSGRCQSSGQQMQPEASKACWCRVIAADTSLVAAARPCPFGVIAAQPGLASIPLPPCTCRSTVLNAATSSGFGCTLTSAYTIATTAKTNKCHTRTLSTLPTRPAVTAGHVQADPDNDSNSSKDSARMLTEKTRHSQLPLSAMPRCRRLEGESCSLRYSQSANGTVHAWHRPKCKKKLLAWPSVCCNVQKLACHS